MTRERISFTFEPEDMSLSVEIDVSFGRALVGCAIIEKTFAMELSSDTTSPKVFEIGCSSQPLSFTWISFNVSFPLFVTQLVFSALISILYIV